MSLIARSEVDVIDDLGHERVLGRSLTAVSALTTAAALTATALTTAVSTLALSSLFPLLLV